MVIKEATLQTGVVMSHVLRSYADICACIQLLTQYIMNEACTNALLDR